jgi:alpha-amylase/alpha-mannosidase (GH57 family)
MNRVNLVLVWHMHQPQYRDSESGSYLLPWTRLHALKDYWGMVKILEEFPGVHVTFNLVPLLVRQLEEYASGSFREQWFELAFAPADKLTPAQKLEVLDRAFQINHENLLPRWPRFQELFDRVRQAGVEAAVNRLSLYDWRDLQLLSQLAWMDEIYLASDPIVRALSEKGTGFTEQHKAALRAKQLELLARVLPEYRGAAERGQIEISTTPFYHPILPLLIDTDVARVANPQSLVPQPPFRFPEDARAQLQRAREAHERAFGQPPAGLWPSEGSVSTAAIEMAAELGFRWFASDEGVLGRTLGVWFGRGASGLPENAGQLYRPLSFRPGGRQITGIFRDHYLSDLIGFVYGRMDPAAAAADLHARLRAIGEKLDEPRPLTVCLILDGENAWEYYRGNGRDFLRQLYHRLEDDPDVRARTVSEAVAEAGEIPAREEISPGSWINANFDIWIGHAEDVRAWELLRDARQAFARAAAAAATSGKPSPEQLARSYEAVLAAEGSDWCWWYGPEHVSSDVEDFDDLYRRHVGEVYAALGIESPEILAEPIKKHLERALIVPPEAYIAPRIDGRVTNYFEWLGAGLYSADRRAGAMHGRSYLLRELHYGFDDRHFYLRVDLMPEALAGMQSCECRVLVRAAEELRVIVRLEQGRLAGFSAEKNDAPLELPAEALRVAFDRILEVALARELVPLGGRATLEAQVAIWHGGLPVDVLPAEGPLAVQLGEENFAWPR